MGLLLLAGVFLAYADGLFFLVRGYSLAGWLYCSLILGVYSV